MQSLKHYNMGWQKKDNAGKNCSSSCSQSQNKRQQNNSSTVYPSEDVIFFDILTRLPATCLLSNARFVCKSWAAIICNSQFVEAHLRHAKPGLFLQSTRYPYGARFLDIKDNGEFEVTDLNPRYPGRILNSCDGLSLFIRYATGSLYVANPVTMQVARVPVVLGCKLMYPPCTIARVPRTGEFKFFASYVQKQSGVCVSHWYVLRHGIDNSWRKIGTESGDFDLKCNPIYTGGYDLYWITEHRVIVMDVEKETFRAFQLPQEHRRHPQYLKMGNCLSSIIFLEQGYQIRIFDPESGKWTFYHHIGRLNYPTGGYEVLSEFFCVWMNHEVIIKTVVIPVTTMVFGYNVKTRNLRMINVIGMGSYDLGPHTNSLVSWKSALP